ncbi:hypothetical protein PMV_011 [Port-miou virus]|uniref:Peptidase S74 domain-containing protein n=1 Tax=Port-miou virus TaxID=1733873 RepID=A0A0N9PYP7_9VIRU|nr:hypothetical protein PMV_011 [Port-miou virus]
MSSTTNSVIKKEFVVSRNLVIPVYKNIASVPEPVVGSIAYNNATQGLLVSNGLTWSTATASAATPTARGTVFAQTSIFPTTTVSYGNLSGTAPSGNTFIGWRSGFTTTGAQTGLTFLGYLSGGSNQTVTNKTMIGRSAGTAANAQQNSTGFGSFVLSGGATGLNNSAAGFGSQSANVGSGNASIGASSLGVLAGSQFNNSVAIGYFSLAGATTPSGIVNIGAGAGGVFWNAGTSSDVVYLGQGSTLTSNITNVIALGFGSFAGAPVANNTLVISNGITQWRSIGLGVSASANILQFDPVTGLITQAASSKRFKQNIHELPQDFTSDIFGMKVKTYEIGQQVDHGVISEEVPEKYATFDSEGRRNGVKLLRIIMSILSEIQKLREEISELEQR